MNYQKFYSILIALECSTKCRGLKSTVNKVTQIYVGVENKITLVVKSDRQKEQTKQQQTQQPPSQQSTRPEGIGVIGR